MTLDEFQEHIECDSNSRDLDVERVMWVFMEELELKLGRFKDPVEEVQVISKNKNRNITVTLRVEEKK